MNILTFDIEEWYVEKVWGRNMPYRYKEFDALLDNILAVLDEKKTKATFFCLGRMADTHPYVIKSILSHGHEVGCHSHEHFWLNKMSEEMVIEDTRHAIDALEQCIGKKVKSYRAPAFSIGENNRWAIEILSECGISRDASIFPAKRDFGGFSQFGSKSPTMVKYNNSCIKEFPICIAKLFGKDIAYSGGGYFRLFPLWYIKKKMAESNYVMTYFHIGDLLPESNGVLSRADYEAYFKEVGTLKNRYIRYFKTNLGKKSAFEKLMNLIRTEDFVNLEQADTMIDWNGTPSVVL